MKRICKGRHPVKGFTLVELLVAIVIIAVLAGLVVAGTRIATEKARQVKCTGNLKSIGSAISLYCAENDGYWPAMYSLYTYNKPWYTMLRDSYVHDPNVFLCPSAPNAAFNADRISYGYNFVLGGGGVAAPPIYKTVSRLGRISTLVVVADSADTGSQQWLVMNTSSKTPTAQYSLGSRHHGGADVLWGDDHVSWALKTDLTNASYWNPNTLETRTP